MKAPAIWALGLLLALAPSRLAADEPQDVVSDLAAALAARLAEVPDPGEKADALARKALLKAGAALADAPADLAAACKQTGKAAKAVAKPLAGDGAVESALSDAADLLATCAALERDAYEADAAGSLNAKVAAKGVKTLATADRFLDGAEEDGLAATSRLALLGKAAKKLAAGRRALEKASGGPPVTGIGLACNYVDSTISVFDLATGDVLSVILPLESLQYDVAIDPVSSRNRAYVVGNEDLLTIDLRSRAVVRRDEGLGPYGARRALAHGDRLYVSALLLDNSDGLILVRNLRTNAWETPVSVGHYPDHMALDAEANRLWVNGFGTSTVRVVDLDTGTLLASPVVGQYPRGMALDPSTRRAFTVRSQSLPEPAGTRLVTLDMDTMAVTGETWLGAGSYGGEAVAVDATRRRIYVANFDSDFLFVGNLVVKDLDGAILGNVTLGDNPKDCAVDPETGLVYVTTSDGIDVVNPDTLTVVRTVPSTGGPWGLSLARPGSGN